MTSGELHLHINRIVVDWTLAGERIGGLREAIAQDLTRRLGGAAAVGGGLAERVGGAIVASVEPQLPKGRLK